ncbi:hypothetical protein ACFQH6_13480 [Halobacteriaceae archaeon GCM10025711]
MAVWTDVMCLAAGLNVLLLLVLGVVWGRNYRELHSKHALGLLVFGGLLLAENLLALYYFLAHPMLHAWFANLDSTPGVAMMLLRLLESAALVFLTWVTLD